MGLATELERGLLNVCSTASPICENNMKVEDKIREVLDMYIGTQINIDSEAARNLLASHIASELENETVQSDYVDDDLSI